MIKKCNIYFAWSNILQIAILRSKYNERKLSNFTIKLSKKFAKHKNTILSNIEKLTGFKWDIDKINVWVFEGLYPSISDPMMINSRKWDSDFSLFEFVNMLIRLFMKYNEGFRETMKIYPKFIEREAIVQLVTKGVCKRIFSESKLDELCKKAEFDGKYKSVWERELEKIWNLEDKPLKEWVKT